MSRLLKGLRALTGAEFDEVQGDYRKIQVGIVNYLNQNDMFSETDEERNRLLIEGTTYSLYCKTGFPKNTGISLRGMPYSLNENAELFREIKSEAQTLMTEIEEAYLQSLNEVPIIDDTEEETVSDEPIIPPIEPVYVDIHAAAQKRISFCLQKTERSLILFVALRAILPWLALIRCKKCCKTAFENVCPKSKR